MPVSAMAAGADLASVSMHKSGGSLTQSSFLLCGPSMNAEHVRQIINLTQTTSGSYLLMVSLDISRKNLALHGKEIFRKVVDLTTYAREEINADRRLLRLRQRADQRRHRVRFRHDQAGREHAGRRSGRHRGVRHSARLLRYSDRVRRSRQSARLCFGGRP